eukprot:gb/GEZN01008765.1/.p1 GENE.gb/GEZN01008765.1/~~gb/GEZN01008765.1/.p1  ORF type:complete len:379 (+),score=52.36 gb/GEZN01008765.1/:125-1261(+)
MWWWSAMAKAGGKWQQGAGVYYSGAATAIAKPLLSSLLSLPYLHFLLSIAAVWLEFVAPIFIFWPVAGKMRARRSGYLAAVGLFHLVSHFFFAVDYYWFEAVFMAFSLLPTSTIDYLVSIFPTSLMDSVLSRAPTLSLLSSLSPFLSSKLFSLSPSRPPTSSSSYSSSHLTPPYPFLSSVLLPACFLSYLLLVPLNPAGAPNGYLHIPAQIFRLDQRWRMFANPDPPPGTGWWVVAGSLYNETQVDVYHLPQLTNSLAYNLGYLHRYPPTIVAMDPAKRPAADEIYLIPANHLYYKYWEKLWDVPNGDEKFTLFARLGHWMCEAWNDLYQNEGPEAQLSEIHFVWVAQFTLPPSPWPGGGPVRYSPPEIFHKHRHGCD